MSETNHSKHTYRDRMYALIQDQRATAESIKGLCEEMKRNGYDDVAVEGIKISARWRLLDDAKLAKKHASLQYAMNFGD